MLTQLENGWWKHNFTPVHSYLWRPQRTQSADCMGTNEKKSKGTEREREREKEIERRRDRE